MIHKTATILSSELKLPISARHMIEHLRGGGEQDRVTGWIKTERNDLSTEALAISTKL